jgi:eukaryotic-like serine/threonine-protein kinase
MTESNHPAVPRPLFSTERWQELRDLLGMLVDASVAARESQLASIAGRDPELAAQLRALLAPNAPTLHMDELVERVLPPKATPARVGPFRVLEQLGSGGMGTVYLAEREQADFVQRVALKVLDSHSARLTQLAARERRILAALTHPHITAFVDAGVDQGCTWMAMEYVQGDGLMAFCRLRQLDTAARVRLFDQVCSAVAHAHAQLVVHRDLKPSNVLVDGEGRAKLLDFGIALALDNEAAITPATRVFTPEYAAPEQLRGERASTATDLYGLGLMLYELVTGTRMPLADRIVRDAPWSTGELERITITEAGRSKADSEQAIVLGKGALRLLRGDLGRIIAHALHPLPAHRYPSVASLREDLARWLDNRPLTIVRPGLAYVLRRFVRRHRLAVALAGCALLAIIGLAATALWQARAKSIEAFKARMALRQSEATRDFMNSVFLSADPFQGKGAQTTAGELLATARTRIDKELADEPAVAAALLWQIGNVYVSLGDKAAVLESLSKSLAYNARSPIPSPIVEGSAKARLAFESYSGGDATAVLSELNSAIALLRAAGSDARFDLADALRMQGNLRFTSGVGDAIAPAAEAVAISENFDQRHASSYLLGVTGLADMLASLERNEEALAAADRGLANPLAQAIDQAAGRNDLQGVRARALTALKRYAEAEPVLAQVINTCRELFGMEHRDTRYWRYRMVELLESMGRLDDAHSAVAALLNTPPEGDEHPVARIAHQLSAARVAEARRDAQAATLAASAQLIACNAQGQPKFCGKARLITAEIAIRERRQAAAKTALETCTNDESISKNEPFARQLKLLRARLARSDGRLDNARTLLTELQADNKASADETALLDIELGYLALVEGERDTSVAALTRARGHLVASLTRLTPQIREIDAALAKAKAL